MVAFNPDDAGNLGNNQASSMQYVNNRLVTQTATLSGTVTVFGYDHLGEEVTETTGAAVTTTAYDAAGHPFIVTSADHTPVTFTYDALGRVVSRQDPAGVELDFYGGMSSQVVETTDATGTATVQYLLDSSGQPLAQRSNSPSAGTWASFVTDARDNNSALLDTTGAVKASFAYDVFGNVKATATATPAAGWGSRLKFQMAPQDPKLGLYSLGSRLLDPTIGRFTSADNYVASLAELTLQVDPLTGNRYLYAGANPAGMFDDGHGHCWLFGRHHKNGGCLGGSLIHSQQAPAPSPFPNGPTNDTVTPQSGSTIPGPAISALETAGGVALAGAAVVCLSAAEVCLPAAAAETLAEAPSLQQAANGVSAAEVGLPELNIEDSQFGQKVAQHARDFGLDPANPEERGYLRNYIEQIRANPGEIRQGPWNPNGGGGSDYLFFRQGADVVVTKGDGTFVTILQGGESNGWFKGATPR